MKDRPIGYIRDKMTLKYFILYVISAAASPLSIYEINQISSIDECVNYFDLSESVFEMLETGHITAKGEGENKLFSLSKSGQFLLEGDEKLLLPNSIRTAVQREIVRLNALNARDKSVLAEVKQQSESTTAQLKLMDGETTLLNLELLCANGEQANTITRRYKAHAEEMFNKILEVLLKHYEDDISL